jgi:tetratricopeptide (TPR) repeat protein
MNIENAASFQYALLNDINLFVGAGFSVLAQDSARRVMPVGDQLPTELRTHFGLTGTEGLTLPQLYTLLARTRKEQVDRFLRERLSVTSFDPKYLHLRRLAVSCIFTTNIDNLLQRIFNESPEAYLNDLDLNGPRYADRRAIDLVMMHGSVLNPGRPLRFGTVELASSFDADPDRWRYLRRRLRSAPTLFIGYSLQDAGTLEALATDEGQVLADTWIQILPAEENTATADYFRALNFQLAVGDTGQLLNYLGYNLPKVGSILPRNRAKAETADLFPSDALPAPQTVPSRPVVDFFRGYAPGWSDVFSTTVRRVSYFRPIVDALRAGRSTIVTGIPGSGKTTLLMQVVSSLDFPGHKLMLDGPSPAKAEMIVRLLDGAPALAVVDNFTNQVEAFDVLRRAPGVVTLAADRDYNLSSSLHRLNHKELNICDVTELTDADLQDLRASIPAEIRRSIPRALDVSKGVRPSLFEFVQGNVQGPNLRQRLQAAFKGLQGEDPTLAEMLLLASYVHSCRTPLSMDMAIGYWANRIGDHEDIYERIKSVGALLSEYEGDLTEGRQDYFAARSVLAADAVLLAASGHQLGEMLTRFHTHLSPMRITAYYVFKRKAYDSKLFGRAFPSAEDAVELYDEVYAREQSPYLLQQKALFLASRKRYSEAFEVMDRAISTAPRANWTIRSSHAQILFQANQELAGDNPEARELLDRAMTILTECYKSDRRRSMHAVVYSTLAVRYAGIFSDQSTSEYLEQAEQWLTEVMSDEPWVRQARFLQQDVRDCMRALA